MAASALNLGSCIAGIPVKVHYSYFLLLLIEVVYSLRYTQTSPPYPMLIVFVFVLYGPVLLLTIVVHEFGHALTTLKLGGTVEGIVLWPLGGFALCGPTEALSGDLKVALAGPLMHIPMGIIWWGIYVAVTGGAHGYWPGSTIYLDVISSGAAGFFEMLSSQAIYLNIILLCFNLFIPAYPLDGGRIYAASLMLVLKLKGQTAAKVTAITAMLISSGMILYAVLIMLSKSAGSELLLGFVGAYVLHQSYKLWTAAQSDTLGNHPIFGRECYKNTGENNDASGDGGDVETTPVPAQTDNAVLA
mmetsp:Transcript_16135/g.29068  ORF Transcript_16135/g.29068 Transcript_16135/m.29068 type:complete len:302 (-) Transcript_16135:79-984(-)|eukprot:CAMPEP_0196143238 /NCGR_PEP_ID=MMETSP0910-20130528/12952_1 /TAXON_ID=49265 /ORGANISM="Thalassiosira rotula, Strain GSO102" /LENGTH=301 /DNA_ID=CAMNT_0041404663 /DNA_START=13 /DNA_END=918 /DNA_ORIENTATION=-